MITIDEVIAKEKRLLEEYNHIKEALYKKGYNQAIDDYAEAVKTAVTEKDDIGAYDNPAKRICEILRIEAEQLKESGNNEM